MNLFDIEGGSEEHPYFMDLARLHTIIGLFMI